MILVAKIVAELFLPWSYLSPLFCVCSNREGKVRTWTLTNRWTSPQRLLNASAGKSEKHVKRLTSFFRSGRLGASLFEAVAVKSDERRHLLFVIHLCGQALHFLHRRLPCRSSVSSTDMSNSVITVHRSVCAAAADAIDSCWSHNRWHTPWGRHVASWKCLI